MDHKIFLTINTDITALSSVLSWFEQLNQPPVITQEIWWQCQTLLIEGFTNIVEHAHQGLSVETLINIEAYRSEKSIQIRILSQGQPFDLERQLQELSEFEENHQERGRGLKIMSILADSLDYKQIAENCYCLSINKSY
ncbi:ATP-binding protein [Nostoc sp. CMAA1605]|uniref:ATP-binding protein n=1 Tax=Nostoc sp. CMAA1605 TaxID=2055159 RepID=UPI001F36BBA1|nr:anti-sigma regulatory factor [Nostoc sp. CMAA1605]MCF4966564.1 ATP-binding protein [Nostoc sp. CMAA1605]